MLNFRGRWRPYQAAVLEKFENYLDDSKIHLIAAPGSGKTVLGVELISRLGKPALVLVPRLSIQRQWVEAIESLFEAPPMNEQERMVEAILFATSEPITVKSLNDRMPHGCDAAEALVSLFQENFVRLFLIVNLL